MSMQGFVHPFIPRTRLEYVPLLTYIIRISRPSTSSVITTTEQNTNEFYL